MLQLAQDASRRQGEDSLFRHSVMCTSQVEQHRVTERILELFAPLPDFVCEAEDKDLKVSVDRSVHFYFYLKERFDPEVRPDASKMIDVRADIAPYVAYFDLLGSATMREIVMKQLKWEWEAPMTSTALRDRYFNHFDALRNENTPRPERYLHLMQLVKLQLFYLAFTFM